MKLELTTGARLHCGLMELCTSHPNCYAGLGLMVEAPQLRISLQAKRSLNSEKPPNSNSHPAYPMGAFEVLVPSELKSKVERALPSDWEELSSTQLEIHHSPELHFGFGTGTQVACAVAAACELFARAGTSQGAKLGEFVGASEWLGIEDQTELTASWLIKASGRGLRSGIGIQGFLSGGLIWDRGYLPATEMGTRGLSTRVCHLPANWRVVLLRPDNAKPQVSGSSEADMIASLAKSPYKRREEMWAIAESVFSQSTAGIGFENFTCQLEQYMRLAGELFSPIQSGLYSSPKVEDLVQNARDAGLSGVGQSSWGPTVFAFAEEEQSANRAIENLIQQGVSADCITMTRPASSGASFRIVTEERDRSS